VPFFNQIKKKRFKQLKNQRFIDLEGIRSILAKKRFAKNILYENKLTQ